MGCSLVQPRGRRSRMMVEVLEGRDCPAVSATFSDGTLRVTGDDGPNQVGIVELSGAVVKINADGEQFPPFTGVKSIVVETFGGDDRVEYGPASAAVVGDLRDRILNIDLGAGDDAVVIGDSAPGPVRNVFTVTFQGALNLGTGRDFVRAEVGHAYDVSLDVVSADGGDDVGVALGFPGHSKWSDIELKRGVVSMDLGAGDNRVSVATAHVDDVEVDLTTSGRAGTAPTGAGDFVALTFAHRGVALSQGSLLIAKQRLDIHLGDADDRVTIDSSGYADVSADIDTGGGNDWVTMQGKYLTVRPRPSDAPARLAFDAQLGDGDDRVTIAARGFAEVGSAIATGGGDDRAVARYSLMPAWPTKAPATLDFSARLGDGDDGLDARFAGYDTGDLDLDFGAGNDRGNVQTGTWIADVTYERSVKVDAQLGAGDDDFRLFTRGYDEVRADVDTGPDGDGRDRVAATFVRPGGTNPHRRNLVTLHSADLDRFDVLGIGYPTADVRLEGHQCQVFLAGGTP